MSQILRDSLYAIRQLRRAPGFALAAALTLFLGIAANSTVLSWISSTLLNPVPGAAPAGEMVTLMRGEKTEHPSPPLSYADFVDLRNRSTSFSGMLAYHDDFVSITGGGTPERIFGALTTADYFEVMGVRPILGSTYRSMQSNEHDGAQVVVLSYSLWQRHFGGEPNIVGKTVELNLHPYTIIGVAPRGFEGCKTGLRTEVFVPLGMDHVIWDGNRINNRGVSWLNFLGVLRPGVTRQSAENELNVLMQHIVQQYPTVHQGNNSITLDPMWRTPFGANVYLAGTLPLLMALALLLLLLACANVANLLLVRSVSRRREFAIRISLGAGRWSLIRQLMLENLLIALAGGGMALLCTQWSSRAISLFFASRTLPIAVGRSHLDARVLAVTILMTLFTAVLSGLIPAWRTSHLSPGAVLKDESLSSSRNLSKSRLTSALVIAQVALSMLLLVCAGLFVRSLDKAQSVNPGFDPEHVLIAQMDTDSLSYSDAQDLQLQRDIVARVEQIPGVMSAAFADFSPLSFTIHSDAVLPEGYVPQPHENIEVDRGIVGPAYLAAMRTPLRAGRDFTSSDNESSQRVAIVNQALADRYWPGQNAIGMRIQWRGQWLSVVGIATNGKYRRITNEPAPLVLIPLAQHATGEVTLHVRAHNDPEVMTRSIRRAVAEVNPNLPLFNITTLRENMRMGSVFERIAVTLAGSFGLLALVLATVGLYGVIAYTTRQRTQEIGIRMALGAAKRDIFRQVVLQGLRLTLIGLAIGLCASLLLTRFLRGLLFGIQNTDPLTFAIVSISLCAVAVAACCFPARRAASVEPMQALHTE